MLKIFLAATARQHHPASLPSAALYSPFSTASVRRPGTGALKPRAMGYDMFAAAPSPIPNRLLTPFSTISTRGLRSGAHNSSTYKTFLPPINWGVCIVEEDFVYVIERLGKYHATLYAGIHGLIPVVDKVAYVHYLKEQSIPILDKSVLTRDGVTITVDVDVFVTMVNPFVASYATVNPFEMIIQFAHSTIFCELAKVAAADAHPQAETLRQKFAETIDGTIELWGFTCCRCSIRSMRLPGEKKETLATKVIEWARGFPGLAAVIKLVGQAADFMIPLVQQEQIEDKGGKMITAGKKAKG